MKTIFQKILASVLPDRIYIRWLFNRVMPYKLDLDNPKTLNEKMQVKKLSKNLVGLSVYVDKYAARKLIEFEKRVPLLGSFNRSEDISWDDIPCKPFIAKTTHDSSGGIIVRDKKKLCLDVFKNKLRERLKQNHWQLTKEYQYKNIKKKIIFEELLLDENGKVPNDFKFNCFNGRVLFIYVSIDREGLNYRKIYDTNWKEMEITWTAPGKEKKFRGPSISKPSNLEEMIEYAEKLASEFSYVRIDLYSIKNKIYFGEYTFMHGSGLEPILPYKFDLYFGSKIK